MDIIRNLFYRLLFPKNKQLLSFLRNMLGFTPHTMIHYKKVFNHKSKITVSHLNNERLEYLGDSVLSSIISDFLYRKYPMKDEGQLTEMRSKLVNRKHLNEIGKKLDLLKLLKVDQHLRYTNDVYGNTFEALIGAIYLDRGYFWTKKFIRKKIIGNLIDIETLLSTDFDFKSKLYKYVQARDKKLAFILKKEIKKNKRSYFIVDIHIDDTYLSTGEGYSKKEAEQTAARKAIDLL